ncbi:MAG: prepilin peptidase [Aigarchaeota archaeon]|nr:prepilin peptidase [Candidatus Pelearchaeum maunauluense]
MSYLEVVKIVIALAMLGYGAYRDIKEREVADKVWLIPGAVGGAINVYERIQSQPEAIIIYAASIALTALVALPFYYLSLYGGADAKALIAIAAIDPFVRGDNVLHGFTGITTFTNGMLLSAIIPITMAAYNIKRIASGQRIFEGFEGESRLRKVVACFIGTRLSNSSRRRFWSQIERREDGKRRFVFNLSIEGFDEEAKYDDAWVTPGIPLLVFLAAGYITTLVYGNLLWPFASLLATLLSA